MLFAGTSVPDGTRYISLRARLDPHLALLRGASELGVHGRAGNGVRGSAIAIQVEQDTGVGVLVTTIEGKVVTRDTGAIARDVELNAGHVELCSSSRVLVIRNIRLVQRDDLLTDYKPMSDRQFIKGYIAGGSRLTHILSSLDITWDCEVLLALVGNELINCPLGTVKTVFIDLGPDRAGSVVFHVGSDVRDDRTLV